MRIDFDDTKNRRNIEERGLSFLRAAEFDFNRAVVERDARKDYPEARYTALGMLDSRLHVLCFTPVVDGIRVISFRKANAREVMEYGKTHATDQ